MRHILLLSPIFLRWGIKNLLLIIWLFIFTTNAVWASYEVKGKCIGSSIFFVEGKAENELCSDEVIYEVIPEESKIVRKAVISKGAGLQADDSEYVIIYDNPAVELIPRNDKGITQHIIKGFGQVAARGGYEIVVIGDDFITTAKSALNYFVLYYYRRE